MRSFFMLKTEDINNMGPYCAIITILKYLVRKGLDSNTRQKGRFRPYDVLMLLKLILFLWTKMLRREGKTMSNRDEVFRSFVVDGASDSCTIVKTVDLNDNLKQVICVSYEHFTMPEIFHYEGYSYEDIFVNNFMWQMLENMRYEIYLSDRQYKDLPEWAVEDLTPALRGCYPKETAYLEYLAEWWRDHDEGHPVCFDEWIDNEDTMNEEAEGLKRSENWISTMLSKLV